MKKNVGTTDKIIRIVAALGVISLFAFDLASGAVLLTVMALVVLTFLVTAITGFCPLYTAFGFSSCPVKEAKLKREG